MSSWARGLLVVFVLLLFLPANAHADIEQGLNVHLSMYCPFDLNVCSVNPYDQYPGNPASGHANFNGINQPWSFAFVTGYPSSWSCDFRCNHYNAAFAAGGSFNMTGPGGLTFDGEITSGTAWQNLDDSWGAELSFAGKWSNGLPGSGDILDQFTSQNGPYASLDVYTVAEPANLALLGTGALLLSRLRRSS